MSLGTLNPDSLQLFYATDEAGPWSTLTFADLGSDSFSVTIPPHPVDTPVYYYVRAKNEEGNWTTMPRYGPEAHYVTQFPQAPPAAVADLTLYRAGDDMILRWSAVNDIYGFPITGVNYRIYGSTDSENVVVPENLITTTTDTTLTLIGEVNLNALRCFQIIAELP